MELWPSIHVFVAGVAVIWIERFRLLPLKLKTHGQSANGPPYKIFRNLILYLL